jgi:hypothetical protein
VEHAGDIAAAERARLAALNTKRRWGYWVWGTGAAVILVPECIAAFAAGTLPFTTISKMTGHLERRYDALVLVVIALIVWIVYSTVRIPQGHAGKARSEAEPTRTVGGRLTWSVRPKAPGTFDDEGVPAIFAASAVAVFALIAAAGYATSVWWDGGKPHYHVGYVIYSLLGFFWIVLPSVLAFSIGSDVPYPTFYRTIRNLEDWLAARKWKRSLGPALAWLMAYLILTGLVILLLHLTLYPFPNITKILNPTG